MELDEILSPWVQQLEAAANPYFQFVNEASQAITELESQVERLLEVQIAHDYVQEATSTADLANFTFQESASNHHALEQELADQQLIQKSLQNKIDELQSQIAVLKTALSEAKAETKLAEETIANYRQISLEISRDFASDSTSLASSTNFDAPALREPRKIPLEKEKKAAFPERHVLLVDDAEINRVLMSHYFKGLPVKLEFAVSVEVALTKCKERRFDLIVVDDELQDLENPGLRASTIQFVGLSNHGADPKNILRFHHVLNRGQERSAFVEQLKGFLWSAELIA